MLIKEMMVMLMTMMSQRNVDLKVINVKMVSDQGDNGDQGNDVDDQADDDDNDDDDDDDVDLSSLLGSLFCLSSIKARRPAV